MENSGKAIGVIALILALSGLGLASYNLFGPNNQLDVNPQYFCYSSTDVQNAIDEIGSGSGTIIIAQDITLSDEINIDQGGNYIIEGDGAVTVTCGENNSAFSVTNVTTVTIQDLTINASDISTATLVIMLINDANDNPVIIQNVKISGMGMGHGIEIRSDNVWVQDCHIDALERGIRLNESSHNIITGNLIKNLDSNSDDGRGIILLDAANNTIMGNVIDNIDGNDDGIGFYLIDADNNVIADNMISDLKGDDDAIGIFMSSSEHNTIGGNRFIDLKPATDAYGMWVTGLSDFNTISDNTFKDIITTDYAYGITCDAGFNTISGNSFDFIDADVGTGISILDDYNAITGNAIANVVASLTANGIHLTPVADSNTVTGNVLAFIVDNEILDEGTGNVVANNA